MDKVIRVRPSILGLNRQQKENNMTVKELIDLLKEQPEDKQVIVSGYTYDQPKTICFHENIIAVYYSYKDNVVLRIFEPR